MDNALQPPLTPEQIADNEAIQARADSLVRQMNALGTRNYWEAVAITEANQRERQFWAGVFGL